MNTSVFKSFPAFYNISLNDSSTGFSSHFKISLGFSIMSSHKVVNR